MPHGMGCEYQKYPSGVTASARSTHSAVEYRRLTLWAGAAASLARRGGVQAGNTGGLVGIYGGGNGNVSVVGSTLTNIVVRAHCRVPS